MSDGNGHNVNGHEGNGNGAVPENTVDVARASEELILAALSEVYDPEIGIDIVSLGLVYGSHFEDDGTLVIEMTLTTPMCPLGPVIETQAHAVCAPLPGVSNVRIELVWKPPWDPHTMASDEAKLELGIY